MNTREIAQEYRLTHWAGIMRERTESGLNVRAFCEREGMHENVYYYWQRKLREAACMELAVKETGAVSTGGWAKIQLTEHREPESSLTIETGGCRIVVNNDTDPALLAKVCLALKSL